LSYPSFALLYSGGNCASGLILLHIMDTTPVHEESRRLESSINPNEYRTAPIKTFIFACEFKFLEEGVKKVRESFQARLNKSNQVS